jgi:hypothetical protein
VIGRCITNKASKVKDRRGDLVGNMPEKRRGNRFFFEMSAPDRSAFGVALVSLTGRGATACDDGLWGHTILLKPQSDELGVRLSGANVIMDRRSATQGLHLAHALS